MRAPERLAPSSVARCICAAKMLALMSSDTRGTARRNLYSGSRSAEIGLHEPSLIENRPVELCIAKFGLVEPRATQNGAGKIETGEIETRELLARKIDRLEGCCGSDGTLDVCARHFRRCPSGDVRSTCCIMLWDAPRMAEVRLNIAIAPIRIEARIIVSSFSLQR